ncbi:peptidase C26 [Isosphaera pallida ATCC 43644]|uniref:Peptidase C26 n=1 Tax=Isosphaera pallida (strain ATCC 43644 / DSM 9630 / IS1B) TaxID=575540 RepID=E8QYG4_ISOPI|nr:gamma-glutamyl-gamma-aminobutyrate hydrolase family protein [Isosphaera pallida]ADV64147.1 peptidase C26 [Isosphaera pallida ATCC 43644]
MKVKDKERPLIGINTDFRSLGRGTSGVSQVHSGYYDCILTAGGIPILIPPISKDYELFPLLDKLDGLVLTGGDDLDPRRMGLPPHRSVKVMAERREACDRLLCKYAADHKLPVVGIGLGLQEMNVCYGGNNYLHLPEDLPKSLPHYDPHGAEHRHIVEMLPHTKMFELYGEGEICVVSAHHQGVRRVAPGFRPSAVAPDGLIEAIESKDASWFAIGVQWHAENQGHLSLDMQLFEAFVEAAARRSGKTAASKIMLAKAG